jgi:hypothetical protein
MVRIIGMSFQGTEVFGRGRGPVVPEQIRDLKPEHVGKSLHIVASLKNLHRLDRTQPAHANCTHG